MKKKEKLHNLDSTVWHYYDEEGNRIRKRLQAGELPTDPTWIRGGGPQSDEVKKRVGAIVSAIHTGKVISDETKELMRQAKLGVPKSPEHRAAMSLAQRRRQTREHMTLNPDKIAPNK